MTISRRYFHKDSLQVILFIILLERYYKCFIAIILTSCIAFQQYNCVNIVYKLYIYIYIYIYTNTYIFIYNLCLYLYIHCIHINFKLNYTYKYISNSITPTFIYVYLREIFFSSSFSTIYANGVNQNNKINISVLVQLNCNSSTKNTIKSNLHAEKSDQISTFLCLVRLKGVRLYIKCFDFPKI